MMSPDAFLSELDAQNQRALDRIGVAASREPAANVSVAMLLTSALKNELEATECAAAWIASTPELDAKLAFARQAGDEAKHYGLVQRRLRELGVDADVDPGPRSAMLEFLLSLSTTVERVAAGQFAREALALVRNDEFIRFCAGRGDEVTASLYANSIQPDERHHHELGRTLLRRLATTDSLRDAARRAAAQTLTLAEELQEIAHIQRGVSRAPGC